MFETIFDLIQDPANFCNWTALVELLLSFVALVVGIVAVACVPALAPLGAIVALGGAGGLIFGHL